MNFDLITWHGYVNEATYAAATFAGWVQGSGDPAAAFVLTALIVLALPLGIALARWLFAPEGDGMWAETDEDYGRRVMSPDYRGWRD